MEPYLLGAFGQIIVMTGAAIIAILYTKRSEAMMDASLDRIEKRLGDMRDDRQNITTLRDNLQNITTLLQDRNTLLQDRNTQLNDFDTQLDDFSTS